MQAEEEPEQRIAKMKDYAQQYRSEIEKMKVEHEAQIAELQLRVIPESPLEVREQRRRDIQASTTKISDLVSSASKLLDESVEAWEKLQDNPKVENLQETIKQWQTELDAVKAEIKTLPPMQKMLKVKQSNELQQGKSRRKETLLVSSMQPLINKALELSTIVDSQLKFLKGYDASAQEKVDEASAAVLQEMVEKEQVAEDIMRSLNKQFTIFANKILPPKKQ